MAGPETGESACRQQIVVICMTQDAMPADETLMEELVKPFDDPEVWAAYARQLPKEDCREVEKYTRSFNYPEQSMDEEEKKIWPDLGSRHFSALMCVQPGDGKNIWSWVAL